MMEEEFRYKDTRPAVDHELVCNAGRRTPIGGDMCICPRLRDEKRLIEILRGNLALHRRRVKDYFRRKMMEEAVEESIAAIKVKNQLKDMGEKV